MSDDGAPVSGAHRPHRRASHGPCLDRSGDDVIEIAVITPVDTHDLRRRVLRDGTPSSDVVFDGDDLDDTLHLGAFADGRLVGVSTWLRRAAPDRPTAVADQLRGMATDPDHLRSGVGSALLAAGLDRSRRRGASIAWARARVTAIGFYERHGFEVIGDEYVDDTTGLPHRTIVHKLG